MIKKIIIFSFKFIILRITIFVVLILPFVAVAQISQDASFSVAYQRGCAPLTVNIQELIDYGDEVPRNYIYEANLGTVTSVDTFYTYEEPGDYLIYQIISEGDDREDSLWIQVSDPVSPEFSYFYCDRQHLSIEILDDYYDSYRVYTSTDTFMHSKEEANPFTIEVPEVDSIDLIIEGFYNGGQPNCGSSPVQSALMLELTNYSTVDSAYVNYVCQNEVSLQIYYEADSITYYNIEYQSIPDVFTPIYDGLLDSNSLFFPSLPFDASLSSLCFRINALSLCNDENILLGDSLCLDIKSDTTAFNYAYATYDSENHIALHFSENSNGLFHAVKYVNDVLFDTLFNIQPGHIDSSVYPIRKYSYELLFTPSCDASIQKIKITPTYLELSDYYTNAYTSEYFDGTYKLGQTLDYQLVNSDQTESITQLVVLSQLNAINITHELGTHQKIWTEGTNAAGITLRSNAVKIKFNPVIYVPEAFSPNGNGINETLKFYGLPTDQFTFKIFNLAGKELFITKQKDNFWDGRQQNGDIVKGSYVYQVNYYTEENKLLTQQGSFVLIK
ncbi:MAG: T9SS type B sorting domain-containing protein [Flammeovirgaceae bacterium]|nr:T9SS type B sorting domain-containing protein [Flammeovirgaceae bacterium]